MFYSSVCFIQVVSDVLSFISFQCGLGLGFDRLDVVRDRSVRSTVVVVSHSFVMCWIRLLAVSLNGLV